MKKIRLLLIAIAALMLCSCIQPSGTASEPPNADSREKESPAEASFPGNVAGSLTNEHLPEPDTPFLPEPDVSSLSESESVSLPQTEISSLPEPEASSPQQSADLKFSEESASKIPRASFSLADVEPYSGQPYAVVSDNAPYFSERDLTADSFALYSELDESGRCGTAYACVGLDLMPTEERGTIGNVRPTGWHTVKYNGIIDGNYLYNRCHLIGYLLCGENANEKNLITGTRYLNVQGMLPFENTVADYVAETGNHVLYRVTPIFEGDNLLASGVLMEAQSVEDGGKGVSFCVYVYNVQPGITIDYTTGESSIAPDAQTPESATPEPSPEYTAPTPEPSSESIAATPEPVPEPTNTPPDEPAQDSQAKTTQEAQTPPETPAVSQEEPPRQTAYVLNTNTKKFHYPSCRSVKQMKEKNKQDYTGSRDDIISMGYESCKICCP